MIKGELKKKEIIRTAEMLFCRNGYEATGIQEILDELHTSKGSFYHHFVSKEALLEEICRIRAEASFAQTDSGADQNASSPEKLNTLLSGMIPFNGEKVSFLLMILPVFRTTEGVQLRSAYGKALTDLYSGPVSEVLNKGVSDGCFTCRDTENTTEIILLLINHLWMKICDLIVDNESAGEFTDPASFLSLIRQYRLSVEKLLGAAFGSVELIRLSDLQSVFEQIHLHWKQNG